MNEEQQKIFKEYLQRIEAGLPSQKVSEPFVLGVIGLIASGKTTVTRYIAEKVPGTVIVRADSIRYLLSREGMEYGHNVDVVSLHAVDWILNRGFNVLIDRDCAESEKRELLKEMAALHGAKLFLIQIKVSRETALKRLEGKWKLVETGEIPQNFEHFLVVTRGKEWNLHERVPIHETLDVEKISQPIAVINNDSTLEQLKEKIDCAIDELQLKE